MSSNRKISFSLCFQIAHQKQKVLHELKLLEELLLEHGELLNQREPSPKKPTRAQSELHKLTPNQEEVFNEIHYCDQSCNCGGPPSADAELMGMESIFKKIRAFFTPNGNGDNKRKRRSPMLVEPEHQHLHKYRKVDNNFPKYYHPMSDLKDAQNDNDCVLVSAQAAAPSASATMTTAREAACSSISTNSPIQKHKSLGKEKQNNKHLSSSKVNSTNTTSGLLTNGFVKHLMPRSMFDTPQTTRKVIQCKNITNGDFEVVDVDEDDEKDCKEKAGENLDLYRKYVKYNNKENTKSDDDDDDAGQEADASLLCDLTTAKANWTTNAAINHVQARPYGAPASPPPLRALKPLSIMSVTSVAPNSEYQNGPRSISSQGAPSGDSAVTMTNSIWPSIPHRAAAHEREYWDHKEYLRLLKKHTLPISSNERVLPERETVRPRFGSTVNVDRAYDKQEKFAVNHDIHYSTGNAIDITELSKPPPRLTSVSNHINARQQLNDIQDLCESDQSDHQTNQTNSSVVEAVDLTDDDGDHPVIVNDNIVTVNGLDHNQYDSDSDLIDNIQNTDCASASANDIASGRFVISDVEPVNSLQDRVRKCEFMNNSWTYDFDNKWRNIYASYMRESKMLESQIQKISSEREKYKSDMITKYLARTHINEAATELTVSELKAERDEDIMYPITDEHNEMLHSYFSAPPNQVLISKFNLQITRQDILSLCEGVWLNDEVINFYMSLLTERSEQRQDLPSVYAMNTFFVQRLSSGGYAGVRRWTRKINIFEKDIIPVPVHVGGVHWCMAIIHLKEKYIKYYDSMGQANTPVLHALERYLQDESLDKLKQVFDTSDFKIESVKNSPRQTNGSDCGVFSCMTAEYITRQRPVRFTQGNMSYFRKKMILEIVGGQLWH